MQEIKCGSCEQNIFATTPDNHYKCEKDAIIWYYLDNYNKIEIFAYHDECKYELSNYLAYNEDKIHTYYISLHDQNIYDENILVCDKQNCKKSLQNFITCDKCKTRFYDENFIKCKYSNNELKTYHLRCITKEIASNAKIINYMSITNDRYYLKNKINAEMNKDNILNDLFCDTCNLSLHIIDDSLSYYKIEHNDEHIGSKNYHLNCIQGLDLTECTIHVHEKNKRYEYHIHTILTDPFIKNKSCVVCKNNQLSQYDTTYLVLNDNEYDFCHSNCLDKTFLENIINDDKYNGLCDKTFNYHLAVNTMQVYRHKCPLCNKHTHGNRLFVFYKKVFEVIEENMLNIIDPEIYDVYHQKCIKKIKNYDQYIGVMKIQYPVVLWQNLKKVVQNNARVRLDDVENKKIIL